MADMDMNQWYQKLYRDAEKSSAYASYCTAAFGEDFSQQGFSDSAQLDRMLREMHLTAESEVLDIGCGPGKMDAYLRRESGARITGLDASPSAIDIARALPEAAAGGQAAVSGLRFICASMDEAHFPAESFHVVFSIDALFFSADLPVLLRKIRKWLKPGGRLFVPHSEIRFSEDTPPAVLLPAHTEMGSALDRIGWPYHTVDLTEPLYRHMKRKRKAAAALRADFIREGNTYLYDYIVRESIPEDMSFDAFQAVQRRYLYIAEKKS